MLFTSKARICYLYQGWTQRGCLPGGGGGGGGGAESRCFELIGASHEWEKSMNAGVGPPPEKNENICLLEFISSHFEAHFSIFYNLNL